MHFNAHPFSLRQMQYALAVAETVSFRKAAELCHVSQPSLSTQLALLESALGGPLFERDRKRVLLTRTGREVINAIRAALQQVDDIVRIAERSREPLAGVLSIGVITTIAPYLVPLLRPRWRQTYPELSVRWVEDKTSVLLEMLSRGDLDGAIVAKEANLGDVEQDIIGYDPFVLATPQGHPLGGKRTPAKLEELKLQNVLLLEDGHCFSDQVLALCGRAKARELEFRATSLPTLTQMVADGLGITLLPQMAVAYETSRGDLLTRSFSEPELGRTIVMISRRQSPVRDTLSKLTATAREAGVTHGKRKPPARRTKSR